MDPSHALVLVAAGIVGGFVAGTAGVGGGIVFAPVLLFHFRSIGVEESVLAELTIGTSLLCTLIASGASAWSQWFRQSVEARTAVVAGVSSAASIVAITWFVTSRPWFDARVFQALFAMVLVAVATGMLVRRTSETADNMEPKIRPRLAPLLGTGLLAGAISATSGVGGGVVLVPIYYKYIRLRMQVAVGTSSATIVIIAMIGALTYVTAGLGEAGTTPTSFGFVDVARALLLAAPAAISARVGVAFAHRVDATILRRGFAVLMLAVALQLIWSTARTI